LWNERAMLQRDYLHNEAEACRLLKYSLELDPQFDQTQKLAEGCP